MFTFFIFCYCLVYFIQNGTYYNFIVKSNTGTQGGILNLTTNILPVREITGEKNLFTMPSLYNLNVFDYKF